MYLFPGAAVDAFRRERPAEHRKMQKVKNVPSVNKLSQYGKFFEIALKTLIFNANFVIGVLTRRRKMFIIKPTKNSKRKVFTYA